MGRSQSPAGLVKESAGERTTVRIAVFICAPYCMLGEQSLGLVPEFGVDDRLVLTRVASLQVANFAFVSHGFAPLQTGPGESRERQTLWRMVQSPANHSLTGQFPVTKEKQRSIRCRARCAQADRTFRRPLSLGRA